MYTINLFAYAKPSLHCRGKSELIVGNDAFNAKLNLVCWYVEDFCIYVQQGYLAYSLFIAFLSSLCIKIMASQNECHFSSVYLKSLEKDC
jgi:hypothetical protein